MKFSRLILLYCALISVSIVPWSYQNLSEAGEGGTPVHRLSHQSEKTYPIVLESRGAETETPEIGRNLRRGVRWPAGSVGVV